jgi:hypothetical protein
MPDVVLFRTGALMEAVTNWRQSLISDPLHVLEQNLLTAAVIKFRGPAVGVAGDPLSGLQSAVIFQKIRDARRPERVRRIVRRQSSLF